MPRLFDFLKEADAESIRRSHRRRAKEIATSMSKEASTNKEGQATTTSSRRTVQRTSAPRIRGREQDPSLIPFGREEVYFLQFPSTNLFASTLRAVAKLQFACTRVITLRAHSVVLYAHQLYVYLWDTVVVIMLYTHIRHRVYCEQCQTMLSV